MFELHFLRPVWFFALIPLIVLFVYLRKKRKQPSAWREEVDSHLIDHILVPISQKKNNQSRFQPSFFVAMFWIVSVIALSGPSWDKSPPIELLPDVSPLVVVLDLSRSMQTRDVYPNRIKQAQYKLRTLFEQMPSRPVALVVFSAQAHRVMPLTQDTELIAHLLEYMSSDLMPAYGSNRRSGLELATDILGQNTSNKGQILLVTDGIDSKAIKHIKDNTINDFDVLIYAVATKEGGYVLNNENDKLLTDKGPVFSKLADEDLIQLSHQDLIYYQNVTSDAQDITTLLTYLDAHLLSDIELGQINQGNNEKTSVQIWYDRGGLFIILLLPLALLMFRPGMFVVLIPGVFGAVLFFTPDTVAAKTWNKFWYNQNELGMIALESNDFERAEQQFSEPFWIGVAQYRLKKYEPALTNFSKSKTANAFYNKGNTLVHLQRYKEAIEAYEMALKLNETLRAAKYNLNKVKQFRRQSEKKETPEETPSNKLSKARDSKLSKSIEQIESKLTESEKTKQDKESLSSQSAGKGPVMSRDIDKLMKQDAGKKNDYRDKFKDIGQSSESNELNDATRSDTQQNSAKKEVTKEKKLNEKQNTLSTMKPEMSQSKSELKKESKKQLSQSQQAGEQKQLKNVNDLVEEKIESTGEVKKNNAHKAPGSEHRNEPTSKQQNRYKLTTLKDEKLQSLEHWLDSIQDDPSDLLKEKFKREYKNNSSRTIMEQSW